MTAISPTPAGEGKTTTTVGLGDGLNSVGKNAVMCLREPSLGPCFGMKGCAAGGGYAQFHTLYDDDMPLWDKAKHIAGTLYGAENIIADKKLRNQSAKFEADGYGRFPVCMAKNKYSFSTDPSILGAPKGHEVPIREIRLSAGAEFVVVVCGDIMTMPGLPRVQSADNFRLNEQGQVEGLF